MKDIELLIQNEKKKLESLKDKKTTIDENIKRCKANIEKYTLLQNSSKYNDFTTILEDKGVSFEEIMSALQSGDLLALQEKIENEGVDEHSK